MDMIIKHHEMNYFLTPSIVTFKYHRNVLFLNSLSVVQHCCLLCDCW